MPPLLLLGVVFTMQCRLEKIKEKNKNKKQKDPLADPGADRLLRQDSSDKQSRPSGCCQRRSCAAKTKSTGKENCHNNLGTWHQLNFQQIIKKINKVEVCHCSRTEALVLEGDNKVDFL